MDTIGVMRVLLRVSLIAVASCVLFPGCRNTPPPAACGPVPSQRQQQWQALERYAFLHFNMNTFTGREWGLGGEDPAQFDPTALDCRQWIRTLKAAGFKGAILTAKHHDGFCLWPSAYTGHSVKNSPYKDGQGDIVREFADACRAEGMKMGLYLSPWDRNRADYGKPEYIEYYRNQLRELLTGYGDVFEVWFDGANGGDGWYGGANETRTIDRNTYYDWPGTWQVVRELQPGAVMFSDGGPDVRWVGNEKGFAGETNWSLLKRADFAPGAADREALNAGQEDGTHWLPAEVDVSIRPGWYYHEAEDSLVRTVPQLLDIYYASVGRNASMLLNVPPDKAGRIPAVDSLRLMEFARALAAEFSKDLAADARVSASNVRGHSGKYGAMRVPDGDTATYWATDDDVRNASLTVMFDQPTVFNRLLVQEYIPLGQRVRKFRVEALTADGWRTLAEETTIGYKRILRLPTVTAKEVRLTVEEAKACPLISNLQLFCAPDVPASSGGTVAALPAAVPSANAVL